MGGNEKGVYRMKDVVKMMKGEEKFFSFVFFLCIV